jgi:hypothetical protein
MARPEVWFVLPTASAANCAKTLPAWRERGYRVAALQDRSRFACDADVVVHAEAYPGWPGTVNRLFREVVPASCPVIVSGGDDMYPDPDRRAHELAEQFLDHFGGTFGVMQPHGDAFEETDQFCGSPWLGRSWMESMYGGSGGMCAAYTHHFADDELYWVARGMGALWSRRDVTQYHDHFRRRGEPAPEYWNRSVQASDARDTLMFIQRSRHGFPGYEPAGTHRALDPDVFRREYTGRAERYWETFHAPVGEGVRATERVAGALERLAARGVGRVAIYGAGQHTRKAGAALCTPAVEVVAIIDDVRGEEGSSMWGIPVVGQRSALALGVEAVVLSSDAMEERLWEASAPMRSAGVEVVRLYGERTPADGAGAGAEAA